VILRRKVCQCPLESTRCTKLLLLVLLDSMLPLPGALCIVNFSEAVR
jgi:hypothetical protein